MNLEKEPNKTKENRSALESTESSTPRPTAFDLMSAPIKWLSKDEVKDMNYLSSGFFPADGRGGLLNDPGLIECYIDNERTLRYQLCGLNLANGNMLCEVYGVIDRNLAKSDISFCVDEKGNCVVFYTTLNLSGGVDFKYRVGIVNTVDGEIIWSKITPVDNTFRASSVTELNASLRSFNGNAYCSVSWKQKVDGKDYQYRWLGRLLSLNDVPTFIVSPKDNFYVFSTLALAPGCKLTVNSEEEIDLSQITGLEDLLALDNRSGSVWEYCVIGKPNRYPFRLDNDLIGAPSYRFVVSPLGVPQAFYKIIKRTDKDTSSLVLLPRFFLKEPRFLLTREGIQAQVTVNGNNNQTFVLDEGDDAEVFHVNTALNKPVTLKIKQPTSLPPVSSPLPFKPEQNQMGEEADIVIVD